MQKFKIPNTPPTVNKCIRFPNDIVNDVEVLSRKKGYDYSKYIDNIIKKGSYNALCVKLADLKNDYNILLKAKEDSDYFIKNDLDKKEYKHIKNELARSINLD